eukprot:scaffold10676_cov49-Cyclotella_meneghiniana.AAC.5
MSSIKNKRARHPGIPQRKNSTENPASPTKPPDPKKRCDGATVMEEDWKKIPTQDEIRTQRLKEREERKKKIEQQKLSGKKESKKKSKSSAKKEDDDEDSFVVAGRSDDESTVAPKQPAKSKNKDEKVGDDDEVTPTSKKTADTKASRGRSRSVNARDSEKSKSNKSRSRSASKPREAGGGKGKRGQSVPPKAKKAKSRKSRGLSVDSAVSEQSQQAGESSSSSSTPPANKRRQSKDPPKSSKSAKFKDDIPNNEGKTASTKKHAKAKKKESYAKKASTEIKKSWIYETIIHFDTKLTKCNKPCDVMYGRMADVLRVFQEYDPECAIGDHLNSKAEPIRSPAEYNWKSHTTYQRHYTLDWEPEWQWDKIGDKGRAFKGAFILLSDKPAEEILRFCRVDLRAAFKGSIAIKEMQVLHTNLDLILLGVHANTNTESIAHSLREGLKKAEEEVFRRKELYELVGAGRYEDSFEMLDNSWKSLNFPEMLGVRSYPKQGPYEEAKAGEDTSWKLAQHIMTANHNFERIEIALAEFKRSGALNRLFGNQAIIVNISEITRGGKDMYTSLIIKHQNTNRSVGNVTLPGALNIDAETAIYFEELNEAGEVVKYTYKTMTVRDVIRKAYVKIDGRKIPVFQYASKTSGGHYQLWFWDTVPEIRDFVNMFSRQGAAYLWHKCMQWGWSEKETKELFQKSFDSNTAISAMNSKWSDKKGCAVEIELSPEAAAFLNFGSNPYILNEGEDKVSRQKRQKAAISRGNLAPKDVGGVDAEDLDSVGDESNAETIVKRKKKTEEDSSSDEEDDVSQMSEEEEPSSSDESTVAQAKRSGEDSDEEEYEDYIIGSDEDSAFSTKAGREDLDSLKEQGKKIGEDTAREYQEKIKAMEMDRQEEKDAMNARMAELEERNRQMAEMFAQLSAAGGIPQGGQKTPTAEEKVSEEEVETKTDADVSAGNAGDAPAPSV